MPWGNRATLDAAGPRPILSPMTLADQLFTQAKLLPDPLVRDALDFVLFLRQRQERAERRDLMDA